MTERDLAWEGGRNVRDLGGLGRVRRGAVVRLAAPEPLTAAGWAAAWAHGVRTVVDLRDDDEVGVDEAERPSGITTLRVPLDPVGTPFYDHWAEVDSLSSPLYYPAFLAEYPDRVVTAVRAIATAPPGGVAVHCASGKDRTGLVTLVLLTLAGATPAEIVADYVLSYQRLAARHAELGHRDQHTAVTELLARHDTTIEDSLTSTVRSLTMPAYLLTNGLSTPHLTALQTRLLP